MIGLLLALAGLGLGIAVLVVVWVVVHRDFGARRLRVDDLDIYRSANELIEQHGEDAPLHAVAFVCNDELHHRLLLASGPRVLHGCYEGPGLFGLADACNTVLRMKILPGMGHKRTSVTPEK